MPQSVQAILVLLMGLFPGLLGYRIYESFVGSDWREKDWRSLLRLLSFSVLGVALYSVLGPGFGLPPAVHLFPSTYEGLRPTTEALQSLSIPFLGHLLGGALAGGFAVAGSKMLARIASGSAYPAAWDDFVRLYAPNHWVIVSMKSGEAYAGKLRNADVAVSAADRDLILEEPCQVDFKSGYYIALNYQHLFVSAETWYSVSVVHDPALDARVVPVGEPLFKGGSTNEPQEISAATTTAGSALPGRLEAPGSAAEAPGTTASAPSGSQKA